MGEHHEGHVFLSGEGNPGAPAADTPGQEEPRTVHLNTDFMNGLGKALESCMSSFDALREEHGIPVEDFPGIIARISGPDFAMTYIGWREYKEDPDGYMERQQETLNALSGEDGNILLPEGQGLGDLAAKRNT